MHRRERSGPGADESGAGGLVGRPTRRLQQLAFWLAIVLPAGYGPLFVVGLDDTTGGLLAVLACLNLLCLLVGHDYSP